MSVTEHKKKGHLTVRTAVITLSDTRSTETDTSGRRIRDLLQEEEHQVISYAIIKDEPHDIKSAVMELLQAPEVDVIITNGGTGIAPRDTTFEAIQGLLEKEIVGF